jgi:hypothetical protein
VAQRVDELMAREWKKNKIVPTEQADDAEFHRRIYLDLVGRVPTADNVRDFLASREPNKRAKLVDTLLRDSAHHAHFARLWRELLVPTIDLQERQAQQPLETWLRDQFANNTKYDQLTRALITANARDTTPAAIYARSFNRDPGNAAAATARVFLGVRLECARCHNHPFASWTRDQFWQLAAVFEDMEDVPFRVAWAPRIRIPDTTRVVMAALPDGTAVKEQPGAPRDQLSRWIAKPDNAFFARATVNRIWTLLCGSSLAELVEDGEDPPMHASACDELAREFVRSGFDIRFLIRTITATQAYQFTSMRTHESQDDPKAFSRMAIKPLSGDQLADTISVVFLTNDVDTRNAILLRFSGSDGETTILQALWWMNGDVVSRSTNATSRALIHITNTFLPIAEKVEELFLLTLNRKPTKGESERFVKYITANAKQQNRAIADVFWVLLNSTEFSVNH